VIEQGCSCIQSMDSILYGVVSWDLHWDCALVLLAIHTVGATCGFVVSQLLDPLMSWGPKELLKKKETNFV
jgi:hypothetical protein